MRPVGGGPDAEPSLTATQVEVLDTQLEAIEEELESLSVPDEGDAGLGTTLD